MAIADDISVAANGDIRYTGTTTNYTVLELHRFLQDLADDATAAGDDLLDITDDTPSERSTDNIITLLSPYNIDDDLASHLYDGSIIQGGGDDIYDGIVVFAPQGTYVDVVQNAALVTNFWTTGLNADAAQGISHRFLVKTRSGGTDIDGRRLLGITREFGFAYAEFPINGTVRGNNVIALATSADLNNQTSAATVAGWTEITNAEGYQLLDVNDDGVDEAYYSQWNRDTYTINQLYERAKWLTRRGSSSTVYGLNGALFRGITHEINVDGATGTWSAVEAVTWPGGSGQLLARDHATNPTKLWIQRLTGVAPTDNQVITGGTSLATATVNVTVIERPVGQPFIGASTGSALLGGYGIGVETTDLTAADKLFDLTNTQRTPPNVVTFTVSGLVSGEDRVLVGPATGGALNKAQLTLNGTLSGGAVTSVVVNEAIPADTPSSGTIRVVLDSGRELRVAYSSWATSTFTITSTDFSGDNATTGNGVYITYIDKLASAASESFSTVFSSSRDLFVRVRDGGLSPIKTFETTATLGSGGGGATAIRTSDA